MARIDWVHQRLKRWAATRLGVVHGPLGMAQVKYGPPMPRAKGNVAPISEAQEEAAATDDAISRLPSELRYTVTVYYKRRGGEADCLRVLCCPKATMYARIDRAHRLLAEHFGAQADRWRRVGEHNEASAQAARPRGGFTD